MPTKRENGPRWPADDKCNAVCDIERDNMTSWTSLPLPHVEFDRTDKNISLIQCVFSTNKITDLQTRCAIKHNLANKSRFRPTSRARAWETIELTLSHAEHTPQTQFVAPWLLSFLRLFFALFLALTQRPFRRLLKHGTKTKESATKTRRAAAAVVVVSRLCSPESSIWLNFDFDLVAIFAMLRWLCQRSRSHSLALRSPTLRSLAPSLSRAVAFASVGGKWYRVRRLRVNPFEFAFSTGFCLSFARF